MTGLAHNDQVRQGKGGGAGDSLSELPVTI
jgi:hypothetical protein